MKSFLSAFFLTFVVSAFPGTLTRAETHALLVGVSEYPNLEKESWLRGPVHDVELVAGVLRNRFDTKSSDIRILAGWPDDEENRPTKANIRDAFAALANKVGNDDTVFILLSGHGSQQPANPDPADLEPDGLDEVFLAADTTTWDQKKGTITGAIIDDEIRAWVDKIRDRGAFVWIVFDSCHSGTMTRDVTGKNRINRRIDPAKLVPDQAFQRAAQSTRGTISSVETKGDFADEDEKPDRGGIAAMYASQSLEPTFELPMPPPAGEFHGLFTFTMMQILNNVDEALTYRDLAETINMIYRTNGVFQPTPMIEGGGLDREVMGKNEFPDRPDITFTGVVNPLIGFEVDAGHLMGLRVGSIIEIFPPAAAPDSDKAIGAAEVTKSLATTAFVAPKKWQDRDAAPGKMLGIGCRAKVLYEKMALEPLRVAVQTSNADEVETRAIADLAKPDRELLLKAHSSNSPWQWSDSLDEADWILRLGDQEMLLIPISGWSKAFRAADASAPQEFLISDADEISSALGRIARARQLVHIAGSDRRSDVKMDVQLIRFDKTTDEVGKAVPHGAQGRVLRNGEEIAFRIRNLGRTSIDISLLFIDSGYGISALFPEPGTIDDNRIAPGQSLNTPRLEVTVDTAGPEQVVALGVRSTSDRVEFSCLEQQSLEKTRGFPVLESPLGQLLRGAMYGDGGTRGLSRSQSSDHATKLITWRTLSDN